jgi:hypothetical protein
MTELYINNELCDTGKDFSIRINRQFINPAELVLKDAQYSYSITLPFTDNNRGIFKYASIEETRSKFNNDYTAELIINGLRVFYGIFRPSEITRDSVKGNLYVPAKKSVKEIFGDLKMNENERYPLPFSDFADSVNGYNTAALTSPQPVIFPYTLYGVLPKVATSNAGDDAYTGKDLWDGTVRMGIQDFAPSVNVLIMLKYIFNKKGYALGGTAFTDERLTNLYMSYQNAPGYVQPWNWGRQGRIHISGSWTNLKDGSVIDRGVYETSPDGAPLYACDLFNSTNASITVQEDPGANVLYSERQDGDGRVWKRTQVKIPAAGLYKITLKSNTSLKGGMYVLTDDRGIGVIGRSEIGTANFYGMRSSLKLLRDRKKADFGMSASRMDGALYRENLPQNSTYDAQNTPKWMPSYYSYQDSRVFVDLAQNNNFVAGFQWGVRTAEDLNQASQSSQSLMTLCAKPAPSWDKSHTAEERTYLAIDNPNGYYKYDVPADDAAGSSVPVWTANTTKYRINLVNSPDSYAKSSSMFDVEGEVNLIVWLEAGELLTVADVSDRAQIVSRYTGWVWKDVTFDLNIIPFRTEKEWLTVDESGTALVPMYWDDYSDFESNHIDLIQFLPGGVKVDDFIDGFCKTFNLKLTQTENNAFELNTPIVRGGITPIDIDGITSVRQRINTPLGLPSLYELGFTINTDEEGYALTGDNGGGEYRTGVTDGGTKEQKSTFSYNWFKNITKVEQGGNITIPLAVVSKHEVWEDNMVYPEVMNKRYTDLPLRFWYPGGILPGTFRFNGNPLSIMQVSNTFGGVSVLNYRNEKLTILDNFFTLFVDGESHYTEVEGYLTPLMYEDLSKGVTARFNGDIYRVAEINGFDPSGRNKTTIKLIKV